MDSEEFGSRRAADRLSCSFTGICIPCEDTYYHIKYEDISPKGVRIFSPLPLDINTYVKLEITATRIGHLQLEGRVCWCRKELDGWRAGIAFDKTYPHNWNNNFRR